MTQAKKIVGLYNYSLIEYPDTRLVILRGDMRERRFDPRGKTFRFVDGFHNVASAQQIKRIKELTR